MNSVVAVVGLGYVGLPLANEATRAGFQVVGYDTAADVVANLNSGISHVDDLGSDELSSMLDAGFIASDNPACMDDADVVLICVPTPLSEDGIPDLTSVIEASTAAAKHISQGTLVVLESTTYPGTTEETVRPLLERQTGLIAGVDFSLAYSPERIDPGNPTFGLRNTPKVVGGLTPECTERTVQFYERFVETVVPTIGVREAEFSKLLENTYRHVNIALMNEMAMFCHELGIDLWASIEAAKTKPFGFEAFYPGPGVGGHCIPIDPNYLSWVVRSIGHRFRFVELAQEISERMPIYIANRVQDALNAEKKSVNGSRVLLLGVTYKANICDQRESPAQPLAARLLTMGADVHFFDPHVDRFIVNGTEIPVEDDLRSAADWSDLGVLVQAHDEIIGSEELKGVHMILDTRGVLTGANVERL